MIGRSLWIRELSLLGQLDRARDIGEETIAMARRQRQPVSLAFALVMAQHLYILRGERERLLEISTEVIDLCRAIGLVQETEWGRTFQAWGTGDAGDRETAIAELRTRWRASSRSARTRHARRSSASSPSSCSTPAAWTRGWRWWSESFAHTKKSGECYFMSDSLRWRGELLLAKGDAAAAEASFREAIAVASRQQALFFELRAATGLARLLHARGERPKAHAVLSGVYSRFTEGLTTKDLRDAAALIEEMAVADPTPEIGEEYPPDGEAAAIEQLRALHLTVHKVQPGPSHARRTSQAARGTYGQRSPWPMAFRTPCGSGSSPRPAATRR